MNCMTMTTPKIVPFSEIKRITQDASFDSKLIDAIAKGFVDFSSGKFNLCPIQTIGAPPMAPLAEEDVENYAAQVCIKSGYITGDAYFVIKVASGGHPLKNSGLMQVFSQRTGQLEALLLDDGILTELRTAAAGAVAVKYLGPEKVNRIGIMGTGIQARYQLRYLKQVTDCREVLLWGRTAENAETLKNELVQEEEWQVQVAQSPKELLSSCNIIVTTTCAREVILDGSVTGPLLIICIGADSVGKQELGIDLVSKADCLVCDSLLQTQERGEFQHAIREGKVTLEGHIQEIGQVVAAADALPKSRNLTIFDSSGVAVQDCVVAKMVYQSLQEDS